MNVLKRGVVGLVLVGLAGCVGGFSLVEPKTVALRGAISVEPNRAWNQFNSGELVPGPTVTWTTDGLALDFVTFFLGIADGKPLYESTTEKDKPPVFRRSMGPIEVMELFDASLAWQTKSSLVTTSNLQPTEFASGPGIRFQVQYVGKDEIDRQGVVVGGVRNDKLYLIFFQGTQLYHYGKYMPDVERLIATARFL
jgi:hypothetical protein